MEYSSGDSKLGDSAIMRVIQVVYFLSRQGKIEQPHLFKVARLRSVHICLKDLKESLAELRGAELPEQFSWSYKRKYKHGYVWQDLKDDDVLVPTSENEFVLKGSEIYPKPTTGNEEEVEQRQNDIVIEEKDDNVNENLGNETEITNDNVIYCPTISPSEIYKKTPFLDYGRLLERRYGSSYTNENGEPRYFYGIFMEDVNKEESNVKNERTASTHLVNKVKEPVLSKGSRTVKSSNIFRHILKCSNANTDDSVITKVKKPVGGTKGKCFGEQNVASPSLTKLDSKGMASATCSQCKKSFKPHMMSSHMMSCTGTKSNNRNVSLSRKIMQLES